MKITRRQLRRIIREESKGSTKKYDDDSALRGGQSELPDALQKGIIDKTVEDREEEEKNESLRITHRQLRKIIKEELENILGTEDPADVETLEDAWAGGDDLVLPIDYADAVGSEPVTNYPETLDIAAVSERILRRLRR